MEGAKEGNNKGKGRDRTYSEDRQANLQDLTVVKIMEEIMEFDEEIKMKQRWINNRMKMLHELLPH